MRASTPSDGNGGMPGADAAQPRLARGVSCMSATTTSIAPTPLIEHLAQTPEWVENNGSRIRGLYSALPPARDVNAAAWDDKLHFWQRMLLEVTKEGLLDPHNHSRISIVVGKGQDESRRASMMAMKTAAGESASALDQALQAFCQRFTCNGIAPRCLPRVLEELHCAGQLVAGEEMTQFARERNIKGSASSVVAGAFQLASKFTSWALGLAGSRSKLYMRNIEEGLTLIWAPLVVKHANQMVAHYSEVLYYADSLRSLDDVHETFAGQLTVEDVNIILRYLHDSGVVEFDQKRGTIKFPYRGQRKPMNDMDHGIAEIRATARALHRQTEELERRAMELQAKARECVSRGQRTSAMRYLQQKKQTESIAQKRLGSLQTIDSIIMRLQSAESDAEVLVAYRTGTSLISTALKDISAESVDEAIGHLHDVLANQADIDAAICAGQESVAAAAWPIPDENELERELEQLTCEQPGQTSATLGDELARLDEIQRELDALPSAPNETLAEQDTRAIDKEERIALTN